MAFVLLMLVATAYESYINIQNKENGRSEDIEIEYKNNNYAGSRVSMFAKAPKKIVDTGWEQVRIECRYGNVVLCMERF